MASLGHIGDTRPAYCEDHNVEVPYRALMNLLESGLFPVNLAGAANGRQHPLLVTQGNVALHSLKMF